MRKNRREIKRKSYQSLSAAQRFRLKASSVLGNGILVAYSVTCIYPIIWLFYSSLKTQAEFSTNPLALPASPSFLHYHTVLFETEMYKWMINSLRTTAISLVLIILLSFIVGYFLSRFSFKGRNLMYGFYMLGVLMPMHALMIPMYIQFHSLKLDNQWFSLIIPYVSFGLTIGVFLVESAMHSVPIELEEAAAIDGASFHHTMFRIVMPVAKPVLVTIGIIQFFACWNEFSFALILISDNSLKTIPVGLTMFKGAYQTEYPKMMTGMFVAMLPAMVLYFSFSGKIIQGMVAGAVKG
jgi:raffinose/stachyose/melibiose transport system permease protein